MNASLARLLRHHGSVRSSRRSTWLEVLVGFSALILLAAACSDDDDGTAVGSGGGPTVEIASPAGGSQVGESFDVQLDVNFEIGEPDTGRDHVHLYYDGNTANGEYGIAYENTFTVTGLPAGEHTVEAVVAHADHSLTDARSQPITIEIGTGATAPGATTPSPTTSGGGDYGY